MYEIHLTETYNSSTVLFSIPVHERQDIIHNQIENILYYNPNAKIILHINPSFSNFQKEDFFYKYKPYVFINKNQYDYKHGKGLMWIHVQNFLSAIEQEVEFETFALISSNELFFQKGLIEYIKRVKNGIQLVPYNSSNLWHNFQKGLENNPQLSDLMKKRRLNVFYGGQAEGNFFEKDVFKEMSEIYLSSFGTSILHDFETEEVVPQTIFASLQKSYGTPFTLQNYTNKIKFDSSFINNLREKSFIIPIKPIKGTLQSPHMGRSTEGIFSVKRIDRDWVPTRYLLTFQDGWTMNRDNFILNGDYYSNQHLRLSVNSANSFSIKIMNSSFSKRQGIQYYIDKGIYNCSCKIKSDTQSLSLFETIGWKLQKKNLIYNAYDFYSSNVNNNFIEWQMIVDENQSLKLWWTLYEPSRIDVEEILFEKISTEPIIDFSIVNSISREVSSSFLQTTPSFLQTTPSFLQSLCLCFHVSFSIKQQILFLDWCKHIMNKIIEPLKKMFHIKLFFSVNTIDFCSIIKKMFVNATVFWVNSSDISNHFEKIISEHLIEYTRLNNDYRHILFISSNIFFKKGVDSWNLYMNKLNFLHYQLSELDNQISYPISFLWFPIKYLSIIKDCLNNVKTIDLLIQELLLNIHSNEIHVIENKLYNQNIESTSFYQLISGKNFREGFLLNNIEIPGITYISGASKLMFIDKTKNNFIYYKKKVHQDTPFQWIGYEILFDEGTKNDIVFFQITFEIKFFHSLPKSKRSGIKTHFPTQIYHDWIEESRINEFSKHSLRVGLNKKPQNILFIFDNEMGQVSFEMKNLSITMLDDD